jgi:hypothetical protein
MPTSSLLSAHWGIVHRPCPDACADMKEGAAQAAVLARLQRLDVSRLFDSPVLLALEAAGR